eukprot:6180584-Pleurochrysis_carterae.AAC.3
MITDAYYRVSSSSERRMWSPGQCICLPQGAFCAQEDVYAAFALSCMRVSWSVYPLSAAGGPILLCSAC